MDAGANCAGSSAEFNRAPLGIIAGGCLNNTVVLAPAEFEKVRIDLLTPAKKLLEDVEQAVKMMPKVQHEFTRRIGSIESVKVKSRDEATMAIMDAQLFESVTVELPISEKGSPTHAEVMNKVNAFAEIVADARGSSSVEVVFTRTNNQKRIVELEASTFNSTDGNPITVQKFAEVFESPGVERITVTAPPIKAGRQSSRYWRFR